MDIQYIHTFTMQTKEECRTLQQKLKAQIVLTSRVKMTHIHNCAGVDVAYWEENGISYGACSIVVVDYQTKNVVEKVHSVGEVTVPYLPGFLAFRELPLILEAAKKLQIEPDVFLFDGNGYLHYEHMGVATHASFFLNKPTVGIGKSYLKIKGHDYVMPEDTEGAYEEIVIDDEVYGRVVRTVKGVKPIFLSCGNYIDLDMSYQLMMHFISKESKLPIPVRLADLHTHELRKRYRQSIEK
ncbi:endonuclease V [Priestia aryabhattai]